MTMIRRQGRAQGRTFPRIGGRLFPAVFTLITEALAGSIFTLDFGPPIGFMAPHEGRGQGRQKEDGQETGDQTGEDPRRPEKSTFHEYIIAFSERACQTRVRQGQGNAKTSAFPLGLDS